MELAELQAAEGLQVSAEEYCREVLHPGLMQVGAGGGGGCGETTKTCCLTTPSVGYIMHLVSYTVKSLIFVCSTVHCLE